MMGDSNFCENIYTYLYIRAAPKMTRVKVSSEKDTGEKIENLLSLRSRFSVAK